MALTHNNEISDKEPKWSDVDKTNLPRIAFADQGEADKKSTWRYPHHWVDDATVGKDGIITDGDMYLHKGGLDAAWAYANGARTGKKESDPKVIEHLQEHRKALGLDKENEDSSITSLSLKQMDTTNMDIPETTEEQFALLKEILPLEMQIKDSIGKGFIAQEQYKQEQEKISELDNITLENLDTYREKYGIQTLDDSQESLDVALNKLKDGGMESLLMIENNALKEMFNTIDNLRAVINKRSAYLISLSEKVFSDMKEVIDSDFYESVVFSQSKAGLEKTLEELDVILNDIIRMFKQYDASQPMQSYLEIVIKKMSMLGYLPSLLPNTMQDTRFTVLVYDPIKTGFDMPEKTPIANKGISIGDVRNYVTAITNTASERWSMRKSQWWVDLIKQLNDVYANLEKNNLLMMSDKDSVLMVSAIQAWLNSTNFALQQITELVEVIDKIR